MNVWTNSTSITYSRDIDGINQIIAIFHFASQTIEWVYPTPHLLDVSFIAESCAL